MLLATCGEQGGLRSFEPKCLNGASYIYICMFKFLYLVFIHLYVAYVYMRVYIYAYIRILYMYACMYVCMNAYIYIYRGFRVRGLGPYIGIQDDRKPHLKP